MTNKAYFREYMEHMKGMWLLDFGGNLPPILSSIFLLYKDIRKVEMKLLFNNQPLVNAGYRIEIKGEMIIKTLLASASAMKQ